MLIDSDDLMLCYAYTEKNGLLGLNSNSGGKWMNQNFLKSASWDN